MIIDSISDLHGSYPKLDGGDLLIIAGDLTKDDSYQSWISFADWLEDQDYRKIVYIAGNHDNRLKDTDILDDVLYRCDAEYLCDSGTEFEYEIQVPHPASTEHVSIDVLCYETRKLKIWGSPWTKKFKGMNPICMAFTVDTEEELAEKWKLIPDDTDILITHSPSWGNHDGPDIETRYGSKSLLRWLADHYKTLKLHVCGHIHEGYGMWDQRSIQKTFNGKEGPVFVNASHVTENYEPVNKPIRVEI